MVRITPTLLGCLIPEGEPARSLSTAGAKQAVPRCRLPSRPNCKRSLRPQAPTRACGWRISLRTRPARLRISAVSTKTSLTAQMPMRGSFPLSLRAPKNCHECRGLGNAAYAGRYGNSDEASGDGFRYRRRELFCLTFHSNYAWIGKLVGRDLVSEPDLVLEPHWAVATAVGFWNAQRINEAADADDIRRVTRLMNGGENRIPERSLLKHGAFPMFGE
jgi:putative chitinase